MLIQEDKIIIPIGCSCINAFQIGFSFDRQNIFGSLFDQTIATPRSTVQILRDIQSERVSPSFHRRTNYELELGYLRNNCYEGFYFWHEKGGEILCDSNVEIFHQFRSKVSHLLNNMLKARDNVHLVWSNIQPNLQVAVEPLESVEWDMFRLTAEIYHEIKLEAEKVFNNPGFSFVCRSEDVESSIAGNKDVFVIDLPKSAEFKGAVGLYSEVFEAALMEKD